MPHVQSSVMTRVHYDDDTAELDVSFVSGKVYRYASVPLAIYVDLLDAESKGEFFNANIKDVFPYVEVKRRGKR
jgi:hypothetical protein